MSLVIAKREGKRVYVGADTIRVGVCEKFKCEGEKPVKICKLENGVIVGFTGRATDGFHISDEGIWDDFENEGLTKRFLVEKVMKRFKAKLAEANLLKENGLSSCDMVLVWKDKIFTADRSFNVVKIDDLCTLCVGADTAYLSCIKSEKGAKEAVLDALRLVNRNFPDVSAPYDIIDSENLKFERVEE